MGASLCQLIFIVLCILTCVYCDNPILEDVNTSYNMSARERLELREEARDMFLHGYHAYMENAYPADELMPLSCSGRYRGVTPNRGNIDDSLGNFSLTLVDSLDTLVILGDFEEFEDAVRLVIKDVSFDKDIVVSVFETNIRMIGGLLSAHVLATNLQEGGDYFSWYRGELLELAYDLGMRLLPAFNTSTGIPHPKVNLKYGMKGLDDSRETCTACAGTMILEMAALSRLTGEPIFEKVAHAAMTKLWNIRHDTSDLMGTTLNVHSGNWVRMDAGIGAGIDSYYEYCLKAYILLGDETYLARFYRHYNAVMKYIRKGPTMFDVHMHSPRKQSRFFMDALLAFWPGLQVLLGDMKPAVETHEMLYQVIKRHTFLPEAFTADFQVHWGHHPLRPEFIESTYFLHRATGDDYYLQVGKAVLKSLQQYARVPCGYAAVKDVRTKDSEDRMDSFVLAETFKYLYMLFADDSDLPINVNQYVLTTEAHFMPLTLAVYREPSNKSDKKEDGSYPYSRSCPSTSKFLPENIRKPMKTLFEEKKKSGKLFARNFRPSDPDHLAKLFDMGISVVVQKDGNHVFLRSSTLAASPILAEEGLEFINEMKEIEFIVSDRETIPICGVALTSNEKKLVLPAGPAQFGVELKDDVRFKSTTSFADPPKACSLLNNSENNKGKIVIVERGDCNFIDKVRRVQESGGIGAIILENVHRTSMYHTYSMASDGNDNVDIPAVFLFSKQTLLLKEYLKDDPNIILEVGDKVSLEQEYGHEME